MIAIRKNETRIKGRNTYSNTKIFTQWKNEDSTPAWFLKGNWIEFSNQSGWDQVIEWALPLYGASEFSITALNELISWREREDNEKNISQVLDILRFVQDEIRYLGIEMGEHSLIPRTPSQVLDKRFGDCKEKVLLFISILRSLNIEAYPAFVNTNLKHEIATRLPSIVAFNHVIAQVILEDETYWIDPSESYQRGPLDSIYISDFRRALVIKPGTIDLTEIRTQLPVEPKLSVDENYIFSESDDSIVLDVKTTYNGEEANRIRYMLASESLEEREKSYLNYYAKRFPGIESLKALEVIDNEASNQIVHYERYRIPNFSLLSDKSIEAWAITNRLSLPEVQNRHMPFSISYPLYISHSIKIQPPKKIKIKERKLHIQNNNYEFKFKSRNWADGILLMYDYSTFTDNIDSQQISTYIDDIRKMNAACFINWEKLATTPHSIQLKPMIYAVILIVLFLSSISIRSISGKVRTGQESLMGMKGRAREDITSESGTMILQGVLWQAKCTGPQVIQKGMEVKVERADGLTLIVAPVEPGFR